MREKENGTVTLLDSAEPLKELLDIKKLPIAELIESATYTREEILALVGMYQSLQKLRVGASNKISAHDRKVDNLSEPLLVQKLKSSLEILENQAATSMGYYAKNNPLGQWCLSQRGCGPVVTAGLLAHIDFSKCVCAMFKHLSPTEIPSHACPGLSYAGQIWSFAGLTPKKPWEKGMKRPYNARLKTLCWNLGKCFVRLHKRDDCYYGKLYEQRKQREIRYNEEGRYADLAASKIAEARKKKYNLSPLQLAAWSNGKLQPAGLEQRACNYAVQVFLSHFFHVGYEMLHGKPPALPWVFVHGGEQHSRYIPPPNWPMKK